MGGLGRLARSKAGAAGAVGEVGVVCGDDAESKQHSEAGPKAWQAKTNQEILRVVRGLKGAGLCRWLDAKSIDRTSLTWTRGENAARHAVPVRMIAMPWTRAGSKALPMPRSPACRRQSRSRPKAISTPSWP